MILFESSGNLMVALGKTIFHSVWAGLLILALLRMILIATPERLSRRRYKFSVASLLLLFVTVLTTFYLLYKPDNQLVNDLSVLELVKVLPPIAGFIIPAQWTWEPNMLFTLCTYLYLAGILFMAIRSLMSVRYLRKLKRSGQRIQDEWLSRLEAIANSLGISRRVAFLESDRVSGPLLIGFLKPAVIVPVGMFTHLSISQVETIIIHELYHLKRLDYLVNLMQLFMEAILFYHPAVWYISDRIRKEREYCCDDAVVQISNDPLNYAKALVCLAEKGIYFRLAPGAGGSSRNHFVTRIGRIIKTNNMKKNRQEKVTPFLLMAAAILVIMLASSFGSGFSITKQSDNRKMVDFKPLVAQSPDRAPVIQDTVKKEEMEAARAEALEEIDWDEIKEEMDAARLEAMEEIDWDQIKEEMEAARLEAMEEIDWDEIKEEMEAAKIDEMADLDFDVDFDFDMETFKENFEKAREEMEEIDWEEMKEEMERNFSEIQIDVEEMRLEIEETLKDIDWDEMRIEIKNSRRDLDSPSIEKEN